MKAEYINHYLTDNDVANFARQSFAKLADNFTEEQNHALIKFLARGMSSRNWDTLIADIGIGTANKTYAHNLAVYLRSIPEHWVPFGHPQISLRMSAPIPIARQAFKHKIGFVESEESRRYISSRPELYVPESFRASAASVKQGSGDTHPENDKWIRIYLEKGEEAIKTYLLAIEDNICPEQARFFLPQGVKVNWVWTGSLYAYANFYNQRSDPHAQKEIQQLAAKIDLIMMDLYPVSWEALTKGEY